MAMPGHLCPFGLKSKSLLERNGYRVDDNLLTTRDEVDAFKAAHGVATTPTAFIGGEALLHKFEMGRSAPFPRHTYPTAFVTGIPRAVNRFSTAARI
ncbi:hypothetical protein BV911_19085 [Pseudoruegeria sp. SK021]|nr:hypothetical protein BV911_19085 [Pseudoruegeria sp. SK021]